MLLLLRWVPGAPIAGAWTAGLSLGSGDRRWGCATVEPGASVDSQIAPCRCAVCGLTAREAVAVIMSYLRMGADPLDSLDCSTFARTNTRIVSSQPYCLRVTILFGASSKVRQEIELEKNSSRRLLSCRRFWSVRSSNML